ncbi:MAG: 4Fe-4S dicluster domain-containing protein [Bacteroidetes bacterium]|nr:4Fe-4S dicluster domain-containing protein [Bacteroidota bacterium]
MTEEYGHINVASLPGMGRRSFLRLAGFSFAGAVLAGCQQGGVEKAIPHLVQPEESTPGSAVWYSTICAGCQAGCGILAKVRDGRPIKLEGNPGHPLSQGGMCAIGQASLLGLYDSLRLKAPLMKGAPSSWQELDRHVMAELDRIRRGKGAVRFLTGTVTSPATRAVIQRFLGSFADARHVEYDPMSCAAILDAHRLTHGARVLPRYHFAEASVITAFDADFLGNWISPVEFTKGYRAGRTPAGNPARFSFHAHFESRVSLTGSNADQRVCVSPDELQLCLEGMAAIIAERAGRTLGLSVRLPANLDNSVRRLADRLWNARGRGLVVCGVNTVRHQVLVNALNAMLDNYGGTVDIDTPSHQYAGNDAGVEDLLNELRRGSVEALFVSGANPVYDLPEGQALGEWMKKTPFVVSFSGEDDETAACARYVCPTPHFLEAWNDSEPVSGIVALAQPTIRSLRDSRQMIESLSVWSGDNAPALDLIRREWERTIRERHATSQTMDAFWNRTLADGYAVVRSASAPHHACDYDAVATVVTERGPTSVSIPPATGGVTASPGGPPPGFAGGRYTLLLHPSLTILDGRHGHNPWLHELPDPVTKIVWDNAASLSRKTAEALGVRHGDLIRIEANQKFLELPVHIQPGQHDAVVVVTLGYGRKGTDRFRDIGPEWLQSRPTVGSGETVGKNAALFGLIEAGCRTNRIDAARLIPTGGTHVLVTTQEYHSLREPNLFGGETGHRRPIVQETTLAAFANDPSAGSFHKEELDSLWPDDHKYAGHHWGMTIDLTACTGCSACVMACQAENNIPVVGKDEVRRNRELAWIRVDRYYDEARGEFSVSHQPMMCQHCGNAPCETVCPVLATVHSAEGLNQQIYNRCVGTRYCANNCPYKMRRFNWFEYRHGDEMQRMVLNPDVTVRERGVMEKCSFCIQRIQGAKIRAKREGRPLNDGDAQPACAQSCPARAIIFGDVNDPSSEISKTLSSPRHYRVLEELGVRPSVGYLTLVRNREEQAGEADHA